MEIDERRIPSTVVDAFCRSVDQLDPSFLLTMTQAIPKLYQGHRVILKNVPVAQRHLKSALKTDRHLDPAARTLLQYGGLTREVFAVLSEEALEGGFSDLATYYGEADFLAAALLDEREAVRELAHAFIEGWDGQSADQSRREQAAENIRSTFALFFTRIAGLLGDSQPPLPPSDENQGRAEKEKIDQTLRESQAELNRLTQRTARERKDFEGTIERGKQEIGRLHTELNAARDQAASHKAALSEVQRNLAELQASLQQRIDEAVGKALSDTLWQWLEPARSIERAVTDARESDLMTRAAAALEKQRSVDRHSGNRATLSRTLEERRQMLAQVQAARIEALTPLAELPSIAAELEHEIGEFERHLGQGDAQVSATVSGLLARINAAHALDDLSEVRQFIQQATAYGLLRRNELDRLYRATNDKTGLLYDKAEVSREDRSDRPQSRFFDLRHAIARAEPFTLVIDGHNVLYALEDVFGRHFVDGHPRKHARFEFGNYLRRIFDRPGADVLLYFDGDDPSEISLSDQVRVIYSGGTGEHRADEAILKRLAFYFRSPPSAAVCLVTRDADLARQANAMGALIMHPEEFAASLDLADGPRP